MGLTVDQESKSTPLSTADNSSKGSSAFLRFIKLLEINEPWTVDRFGRFFSALLSLVLFALIYFHSSNWIYVYVLLRVNQIISAITGVCKFEAFFLSLGLKQREQVFRPNGTLIENKGDSNDTYKD